MAKVEPGWQEAIESALAARHEANEHRRRQVVRALDATHVEIDGKRYVNFASNNYLGLTHHPRIVEAFQSTVEQFGVGSGAAALVSGYSPVHASTERAIAAWKGTEAAVLLNSGYAANVAAVQTLASIAGERGVRFLLDKLCHASLIDAVRGSGANFRIFPHNQLSKLRRLLEESDPHQLQVVVTESIFSMDGDAADLAGIARIKQDHRFFLLLDEAHGSGVYGPNGAGYAAEQGLQPIVDLTVVTLSKAIGVVGGAICASRAFCDAVVNFGRAYIYSTNMPAAAAAAVGAALRVLRDEPQRQQRLRDLSREVRLRLMEMQFKLPPGDSPIIPVILGGETESLAVAQRLRDAGLLVVAIRPPTVPRGGSRLRITLSCEHTREELEWLLSELKQLSTGERVSI